MATDAVQRALEKIAELVDDLRARVQVIEGRQADLARKHETVAGAQRTWTPIMVVRDDLVLASGAAETARIPLSVVRTLQAGRPLDVEVRDDGGDEVELRDVRDRVIARLPRLAYVALPRVVTSPETRKLLDLRVQVQGGRPVRTAVESSATPPAGVRIRADSGDPALLD